MNNDDLLRYPIGKFIARDSYSTEELQHCIERIENLPREIEKIINSMTIKQLDTPLPRRWVDGKTGCSSHG